MLPPDPRGLRAEAPGWFGAVGDFLRAWSMVERFGVDGWLRLEGSREADPLLGDWLLLFNGELERLRSEADAEDAKRRRAEVDAARARRGA